MQLSEIVQWAKDICSLATCAALIIKPVREWIMGTKDMHEGLRCLLRSEIVRIYYRHHEERKLREYEFKNMKQFYKAYKALKGNSFIDHIHEEMEEWDIV